MRRNRRARAGLDLGDEMGYFPWKSFDGTPCIVRFGYIEIGGEPLYVVVYSIGGTIYIVDFDEAGRDGYSFVVD